jgi:hypothetical protein
MYACPACNKPGIRLLAKWWSSPPLPGKCRICTAYVAALEYKSGAHLVAAALLLTAGGFLALALRSSLPVWLCGAASIVILVRKWHKQPIALITPGQIRASRIAEGGWLALLVATIYN